MHTLILLAVLHGVVSVSPVRVFEPYAEVKCPRGYSVWWPGGKEFDNDKYAECIKPLRKQPTKATKVVKDVSLRHKIAGH
ncbi:MAG TPA: hypothetical protein VE083_00630 [Terriglobales bacterium]|nr:hypothetical protein [Terriglobales bacterium]